MTTTRQILLLASMSLLSLASLSDSGQAATEDSIESRGLNLPRVSVPAPPPPPIMQPLAVRIVGDGRGTVTLPPAKACPPACSATYPQGIPVVLAAVPAPGSTFAGWGGACRGTAPCTLRMDRPYTVEAKFNPAQAPPSTTQSPVGTQMTPAAPASIPVPYPNIGITPLSPELEPISVMMADGKPDEQILDAWKTFVTRRIQNKQPLDVRSMVEQIRLRADVHNQTQRRTLTENFRKQQAALGQASQDMSVALQDAMTRINQLMQARANITAKMSAAADAIIRNMRG
ncbi:MAG: hypothetical protein Q7U39_17995 [Nitrospira sp.]|nr:hypothetical protein [Nitrospira sp.]